MRRRTFLRVGGDWSMLWYCVVVMLFGGVDLDKKL